MTVILLAISLIPSPARAAAGDQPQSAPDTTGYATKVAPFFKTYCDSCHAGNKPKGDFSLTPTALANDFRDPATASKWKEVVNVLNGHEMPPAKSKQPTAAEVATFVDWVTTQSVRAELARRSGSPTLRRLNRAEYRNTIRDLVGVDVDVSVFPQDPPAGGFDNNGGAFSMSPVQLETYLAAARQILDRALVEGDRPRSVKWRFVPKAGNRSRGELLKNQEFGEVDGAFWGSKHHHQLANSLKIRARTP